MAGARYSQEKQSSHRDRDRIATKRINPDQQGSTRINVDFTLHLWAKTSGTWINVGTILLGTILGSLLHGRFPLNLRQVITQGVGLLTLFLGVTMTSSLEEAQAGDISGIIVGLLGIVSGGLIGELSHLDDRLEQVGNWLKRRVKGNQQFTEGFVAASLLFCIGPLALVGSLNNGLLEDNTLLTLKATMDGLAAIALSSSLGLGVGFSILPIAFYQGGLSLLASWFAQSLPADPASHPVVILISGVGGLMVLGIGLNLLDIAKIRVASFLPALATTPLLYLILSSLVQ